MTTLLADLGPIAQLRAGRLPRRLTQLLVGLFLYGASLAVMVRGGLGLAPWDVLHSGLIRFLPLDLGQMVIATSFVVLLLWIPLREKPGIGTIANALLIGTSADLVMAGVPTQHHFVVRVIFTLAGIVLCALATAMYIGAQFGRGPRDGLMTGLVRRTGASIRLVRTGLEIAVVVLGLLLGGGLGFGTIGFALLIGPLTQRMLPFWVVTLPERPVAPVLAEAPAVA
ncbi:MAG: membrane protein YczE [Nocardioides sp.]